MTTASPILPQTAPRFAVNAHGNTALQARMDAAADLLGAMILGAEPTPPPPAAPALTPDARLAELADDIRVALVALVAAEAGATLDRVDWASCQRAIDRIAGYTDRTMALAGDEGAWNILYRTADRGFYGRTLDAAEIHDAIEALDIIATGPASLQHPAACADFEAWCMSRGGSGQAYVAPVYAGLRSRPQPAGCYRASDETSG